MASPFSIFRKHQKATLAVLMIVAMGAFIFGDYMVGRGMRDAARDSDQVVISWEYENHGPLTRRELDNLVNLMQRFNAFDRELSLHAGMMPDEQRRVTERDVVEMLLMARKAEQMGMVVSDQALLDRLRSFNLRDGVTLRQIMQSLRLDKHELLAAMRLSDLAGNLRGLFFVGLGVDPPFQRWENYCRVERKVNAQLVAVPAADFTSGISDPDNATLEKFFNDHKEKYPPLPYRTYVDLLAAGEDWPQANARPGEPGFKLSYRAIFQYIKLPIATLAADLEKEITDAEIEDYYEKKKDTEFRSTDLLPLDEKKEPAKEGADSQGGGAQSGASGAATGDAKPAEPSSGTSPAGTVNPMMQDEKPAPADAQPSSTNQPAAPTQSANETAAPTTDATKSSTAAEPAIKYQPLEQVKDTIRKKLARERAAKKMNEAASRLKEKFDAYTGARADWDAMKLDKKDAPEPTRLDLAALAASEGGASHETRLVSEYEIVEQDLGKSFVQIQTPTQIPGLMRPQRVPFVTVVYSRPEGVTSYKVMESEDSEGNRFLFWKIDEQKPRVPELAEVRDHVLQTFKLMEARKPARDEANRLAERARADTRGFKELFSDKTAIEPPEFSWLKIGIFEIRGRPSLSDVEGVPEPGEDFLRTVTTMDPGQVDVAQDYSKNTIYVARVTGTAYSQEALRTLFLAGMKDYQKYAAVGRSTWIQAYRSWIDQLKHEVGYKEELPLDHRPLRDPSDYD